MYKWNEHRYMETGRFEINKVCHEVMNIAKNIVGNNEIKSVTRICECYDQGGGDFLQFNAVFHNDKLTIYLGIWWSNAVFSRHCKIYCTCNRR